MTYVISKNAQVVNEIINDPSVRPFIGALSDGEVSVADLFANGSFAVLSQEKEVEPHNGGVRVTGSKYHGGVVLIPDDEGGLEAHTFALPSGRGGIVADDMNLAAGHLLENGVTRIYGYTPVSNEIAQKFNEKIGFKNKGISDSAVGWDEPCYLYERTQ